jgi:hypothetical protein
MNERRSSYSGGNTSARTKWLILASAVMTLNLAQAGTILIDFEHPSPTPSDHMPIPYFGLLFSGNPVYGISSVDDPVVPGVLAGVVSGEQVFVSSGQSNSIEAFEKGDFSDIFTMRSAYFTSAYDTPYDSPLTISALGIDQHGVTKFTKTFTVYGNAPTFVSFEWPDIHEIELTGGYTTYSANQYVMDDLLVDVNIATPEPASYAMACLGLTVIYFGSCALKRVLNR